MKRGMEIQCVHFASPPYTSPQALEKTKLLAAKIARFGGSIQFLTVPFSRIQEEIKKSVPEAYLMTIMRRFMLRITDELRKNAKALAIANGESVGQVASQTLDSMVAINDVTNTPIIRPVATILSKWLKKLIRSSYRFNHLKIVVRYLHRQVPRRSQNWKRLVNMNNVLT